MQHSFNTDKQTYKASIKKNNQSGYTYQQKLLNPAPFHDYGVTMINSSLDLKV